MRSAAVSILVGLLLASFSTAPCGAAAAGESARGVVEQTVAEVLAALQETGMSSEQRRTQIEDIVYARFDFTTMSKLVLARNWKKFDDVQRAAFVDEFKSHLSRSYGTRIERYEQEEVDVLREREEKRGDVTVLTVIRGGQFDNAEVNYRMRDRDGTWRVIDVIIEGVSLVSNFRSQFKDIISKEGADGLIAKLREKNEAHGGARAADGG